LEKQIYEFFKYKWEHDTNLAISDEYDKALLTQLPDYVQDNIYVGLLFRDFLIEYKGFFNVSKTMASGVLFGSINTADLYTLEDHVYRTYIMQVLTNLEPRFEL